MSSPFSSPRTLLAHGRSHIQKLHTGIQSLHGRKCCEYVIDIDPNTSEQLHKIKFDQTAFDAFPVIIFDAATTIRATLDQIGFAAAVVGGIAQPKSALFPIADDQDQLRNVIARKRCKDLPPQILDLFIAAKPYRSGNHALWSLDQISNAKKHARLLPIGLGQCGFIGGNIKVVNRSGRLTLSNRWDAQKFEVLLIRAALDAEVQFDTNFTFALAFDQSIEAVKGKGPVAALNTMADEVERVLVATEAECRKMGLIS